MQKLNLKLFYIINNLATKNKLLDNIMIFTSKYVIYIFVGMLLLHLILSILHKNNNTKKTVIVTAFITLTIALGISKYNKFLGIILILLSAAVGFSRVYVGHHYPLDIIGGYTLSLISTYIFNKLLSINIYKNKRASI